MELIKCCDMLKDFKEHKNIDISYDNEVVYIGDVFSNYRMNYCPFCGREIKFTNIFSIKEV